MNISNIEWIEKLDCLTDLHVHLDGSLSLESVRHLCGMQNIETGDVKRFDYIPQIAKYVNYNETTVRIAINTNRLVQSVYAIKTADKEWRTDYKVIEPTLAKEYKLINVKTGEETLCKSFLEATKLVNTSKKTLRKYINTNREVFGYKINRA